MTEFNNAMGDDDALLMTRYEDIEWVDDDVSKYQCTRCGRVLIEHYIADCAHKFCTNCKGVVGDGSGRWRCPSCHLFITNIERQDFEFRDRVFKLRVHCANRKYGCGHSCSLNELKEHLKRCEHTRERALPVPCKGVTSQDVLEQFLELKMEMKKMKQKMKEREERCAKKELELEVKLAEINNDICEIKAKLAMQSNVLADEEVSSAVKRNASKILKLKMKSEVLMDLLEKKDKNTQNELQNIKVQIATEIEDKSKLVDLVKVIETQVKENKDDLNKQIVKIDNAEKEIKQNETSMELKLNEQILKINKKMDELVSGLNVKLAKVGKQFNSLNKTVKKLNNEIRTSTWNKSKIVNSSANDEGTRIITEPLQLFHLSSDTLVHTWKDLDISNVEYTVENVMRSEVIHLNKHRMNCQLRLEVNSIGQVVPNTCFLRKRQSKALATKVRPGITYVMKVEKEGQIINTYFKESLLEQFGDSFKYDLYSYHRFFSHFFDKPKPKYEAGETFSMEVHIETPEMSNQFYSDNGKVKGSICPYKKLIEWTFNKQIECIRSPYFYTSPKGYRAVIVLAFCDLVNKWLQIRFVMLKGMHDSSLKKSNYKATFTLVNQTDPKKSVTQFGESSETYLDLWFAIPFEVSEFVVNDELRYEGSVEIIN